MDKTKAMAYWYFQFSNQSSLDICNMLRSIIRQLCPIPIPAIVRGLWDPHRKPGSDPSFDELSSALDEIIQGLSQDVYIIFDALDECPSLEPQSERAKLLRYIPKLLQKHSDRIRLLILSRREPDIESSLDGAVAKVIDIEQLVSNDVESFVKNALTQPELKRWGDEVTSQIAGRLLSVHEK